MSSRHIEHPTAEDAQNALYDSDHSNATRYISWTSAALKGIKLATNESLRLTDQERLTLIRSLLAYEED